MRVGITFGSAVLVAAYAQIGAVESLSSGSVAIALAGQAGSPTGIVISSPLPRSVIQRDASYIVSGPYICRSMTAPPRVRINRIDIAASSICLSGGSAGFKVRSDAPLTRGTLTVVHAGGESAVGTFYIVAAAPTTTITTRPPPTSSTTPVLSVAPVLLRFERPYTSEHEPPYRQTFEIRNAGGGTLTWTVTENHAWLYTAANEQCAVPAVCPDCGLQCSGGIKGAPSSTGASTFSGSGNATVAVRAPGWQLGSGVTSTGSITISSNGGNATVSITIVTPANMEFDCSNATDDDGDGLADSNDRDCDLNPFAGF